MYGYVWLCRAVYDYVGLCRAMYGYVGLCTLLLVTNREPLYDAYTTYLPSSDTGVRGPQNSFVIKKAFSCQTSGLVYCISCRCCPALYIGETGRTLRQRFGEHLRSVEKSLVGYPVAEHLTRLVTQSTTLWFEA